ncbi:MAG TPA: carbamoyltransferase HypF [Gemmatimonadales bacterium]|nr:carbamoyltransferase HypF [Gemmatimonadales bacterium]
MTAACSVRVRGVVQGVGFRPFVFRIARANTLAGWVLNEGEGVEIHVEGAEERLRAFLQELETQAPPAASITTIDVAASAPTGVSDFTIRKSNRRARPTARISPDLPVCDRCLAELFDPANPRYRYPYINCTDCGPRYSIILRLPYDRPATTMAPWAMDAACAREYHDPLSWRFHAQPVACPACGPSYRLLLDGTTAGGEDAIARAASLLREGRILAVKGIGGYHLACDARNAGAVRALRERKFRKEKPFALLVPDLRVARSLTELSIEAESLLASRPRPIVLARARVELTGIAPENGDLGLMLPYTPLQHLLFAAGAPDVLVMTSANRSSEPIAYEDADALERLAGIADAFLVGDRPIARRVEDSVARSGPLGPVILRRSRGYAPGAVATLPTSRPVLALGSDLKNAITLVVDRQAFVSQHIGDLDDYASFRAFEETIHDLLEMYRVRPEELLLAHDAHPEYRASVHAATIGAPEVRAVQHHRAHVASVLAERGAWDRPVLGIILDGTGYGDDGTIWGGEFFAGSVRDGLTRVAHLRQAALIGGDAAARHPVQAAAGFLAQLSRLTDMSAPPFLFPLRFRDAQRLVAGNTRVFLTTSAGRLFDAAAALTGFTRPVTFEGQAAIWLEQLAREAARCDPYPFPLEREELDFRPLLSAVIQDRIRGREPASIARAFHAGVARGLANAAIAVCAARGLDTIVVSGGVFQNQLLLEEFAGLVDGRALQLWTNHAVPQNDGGISLGQAALAALGPAAA